MNSRIRFAFVLCAATVICAAGWIGSMAGRAQGNAPVIHLKPIHFAPARGERPAIPPGLTIAGYAQNQRGYYIVQFSGPVLQRWKDDLTALGAEILEYIPDFAFKVRMNPAEATRAERLQSAIYVGIFQPAYKLSPNLVRNGTQLYVVRIERGADFGLATAAIAVTGAQVLSREDGILVIAADSNQLDGVALVTDVAWVQNFTLVRRHNEFAGGVILGANTARLAGYDGSTQIIAIADTGLGGGTAATAHAALPSERIQAILNWPGAAGGCFATVADDGAMDVDSGHGTHTTVSAIGDGFGGFARGTAPGAKLVFQAVENYVTISWLCSLLYGYPNGYYLTGLPADLNPLYQQAYDYGARIHSNSWGAAVAGDYDLDSANTDTFVWNHRDMTITFSAGNQGVDANSDGIIDLDSMASPATAKNVITVGASENDRTGGYPCDPTLTYIPCNGSNSSIIGTWGSTFGFPANPIKDDPTVGNKDQMAAFSSRGPTDDGRIKPDVVAPGTYVLSGYSDMFQQGYDNDPVNPKNGLYQYDGWAYPQSKYYKYLGGTSMSNPLVAGGAAVVRDYYKKKSPVVEASAALVKATIINSAVDMLDENNDGVLDNDYPIPNNHEGWGRADLARATDGKAAFADNTTGVSTNGTATYTARKTAVGEELKITLVWSDYPSTATAAVNLVNDLDIKVTAPGGAVYFGNVFSGGWSQTGGSADRLNNVENVYIQNPAVGDYLIEIKGYNVPYGPQPFALVVRGAGLTEGSSPDLLDPYVDFTGAPPSEPYIGTFTVASSSNNTSQPVYTSSGACSNTGTLYTMTSGTGTCTSTVTYASDGTYKGATRSQTTTATKINPTTTFTGAPATAANYSSFTVASTTNASSSPVYSATGVCTNSGAVYTMTANSGTCTSTVTWAADNNYNGATKSQYTDATPGSPPALEVHVGNLTSTSMSGGSYWVAGVSILVHDAAHNTVAGAQVTASWSNGYKGSGSCTTVQGGFCTITSGAISNKSAIVKFTVTKISKSGYTYRSASNHDISGDSNGTSITVKKP